MTIIKSRVLCPAREECRKLHSHPIQCYHRGWSSRKTGILIQGDEKNLQRNPIMKSGGSSHFGNQIKTVDEITPLIFIAFPIPLKWTNIRRVNQTWEYFCSKLCSSELLLQPNKTNSIRLRRVGRANHQSCQWLSNVTREWSHWTENYKSILAHVQSCHNSLALPSSQEVAKGQEKSPLNFL